MNITSYSIGSGFNALIESKAGSTTSTSGCYYSPLGIVNCHAEVYHDGSHGGSQVSMVLNGRQWTYSDRVYRGKRSLARLAAKFAREVAATEHE